MPKFIDYTLPNGEVRPALVVREVGKQSEVVVFLSANDDAIVDIGGFSGKSPRLLVDNDLIYQDVVAEVVAEDESATLKSLKKLAKPNG